MNQWKVTAYTGKNRDKILGHSWVRASSEEQAIEIANDSVYGLAAYVQSPDQARAIAVARDLRAGTVSLNGPDWDTFAPFGGYKQSGNGREYADWGMHEFLEVKGIVGFGEMVAE